MKKKLLETLRHFLIYGISSAFQSLIGFLLLPLLTKHFDPELFGTYTIIVLLATFAGAFFFLGATSTLNRYFFESDSENHVKSVVSSTFYILLFGVVVQVLLATIFKSNLSRVLLDSEDYSTHILIALIGNAFGSLVNFNLLLIRINKKSNQYVFLNVISNILNLSLVYFLLIYDNVGLYAPLVSILIANTLTFFLSVRILKKYLTLSVNLSLFGEYLNFGFAAMLTGLSYYLLDWIDRFLIKEYVSLSEVGIYSVGYKIGMIIHVLLIIPFSLIWSTIRFEYMRDKDNSNFVSRIISYYTIIGLFLTLIVSLFSVEMLNLFVENSDYSQAVKVIPIVMLAHLMYGYINIVDFGILISKKLYFFYSIFLLGAIFNAVLNIIFLPSYGFISSAYITFLTYLFCSTAIYLIGNKYFTIKIELNRVLPPFGVLLLIIHLSKVVELSATHYLIFRFSLLILAIILLFFFWLKLDEKTFILTSLKESTDKLQNKGKKL